MNWCHEVTTTSARLVLLPGPRPTSETVSIALENPNGTDLEHTGPATAMRGLLLLDRRQLSFVVTSGFSSRASPIEVTCIRFDTLQ